MECLAMNIPVITTDVGIPRGLDVHKVERDVASIRRGIERYYSWSQVKEYSWENVCKKFVDLYEALV
jgi:glycosyltransferase involved in cell wall biosynthesis